MPTLFTNATLASSFAAFILFIFPLPWLPKAWNMGACTYMAWRGLRSLVGFINGLLWAHNTDNRAPAWCDIATKIITGADFALTASGLAINRRLYLISTDPIGILVEKKRHIILEDLGISFVLPLILTVLSFIPQSHRFDILEGVGCRSPYYNTIPAIFLVLLPPVVLGCISAVYGGLNLVRFYQRRKALQAFMASDSTGLKFNHYVRLKSLGLVQLLATVPWAIYVFQGLVMDGPIHPWAWREVKGNYGLIQRYSFSEWHSSGSPAVMLKVDLWFNLACSLFSFGVFGCSPELLSRYQRGALWILQPIYRPSRETPSRPETLVNSLQFAAGASRSESLTLSVTSANSSMDEEASLSDISFESYSTVSNDPNTEDIDGLKAEISRKCTLSDGGS